MAFNIRAILQYVGFVVTGSLFTILLLVISEITQFTHINFVPLGGPSWALWIYPFYLLFGFLLAYKIFRLPPKALKIILIIFIIISLVYYLGGDDNAFTNPIPFGVNAY